MMTEEQKQARIDSLTFRLKTLDLLEEDGIHIDVVERDSYRIALAALTQPARQALKLPDAQEQVIGVWNPSANEIAVRKLSGIKIVDFAHWHCHCTKEVVIRDISDHPAILNAPHTAPIEPICATGGAEWVKCSDRMPDVLQDVLVTDGVEVQKCWYDGEFWIGPLVVGGVETHWMPLPASPEAE